MKMKYPNGVRTQTGINQRVNTTKNVHSYSNRGMSLEEDINITNEHYLATNKAIIHKKPTPVQIVRVHYPKRSAAVITEAYFQHKSTTDYNGIYKGKHIDFEAKETKNKTLFPLSNFHEHQFEHMNNIIAHDGICFCIIRFTTLEETYFMDANDIMTYYEQMQNGGKKSIPYDVIQKKGTYIPFHFQKRVDYLAIIDERFFS